MGTSHGRPDDDVPFTFAPEPDGKAPTRARRDNPRGAEAQWNNQFTTTVPALRDADLKLVNAWRDSDEQGGDPYNTAGRKLK
ncbi:MAG: hypothetical protein R3E77_14505 [Steroidobacteraceae bacterium]